jgi:asparagine synthetase B (glutamine-hydrolysing)
LFYTVRGGDVYLASEIKALIALGVPARWDRDGSFAEVHSTRTADRTLFESGYAVPPGAMLMARDGVRAFTIAFDNQLYNEERRGLMDKVAEGPQRIRAGLV